MTEDAQFDIIERAAEFGAKVFTGPMPHTLHIETPLGPSALLAFLRLADGRWSITYRLNCAPGEANVAQLRELAGWMLWLTDFGERAVATLNAEVA